MTWNEQNMLSQLEEGNEQRVREAIAYFEQYPSAEAIVPMLRVAGQREEGLWRVTDKGELRQPNKPESNCVGAHSYVQKSEFEAELLKALTHREAVVRAQAAWALGFKNDEKSGTALQSALQDPDSGVVLQVMRSLQKRGGVTLEAVLPLINAPESTVRWAAINAIGVSTDPQTPNVLTLLMTAENRSEATRTLAAKLLSRHRDPIAAGALIAALKETSAALRAQACLSLGLIGAKVAEKFIFHLLIDEDENVRYAASIALGLLGDTRVVPNLLRARRHGDMRNQSLAEQTLDGLGALALEDLVQAMRSDLMPYRADATDYIGKLKTPRATLALIESLLDEAIFSNARQALLDLGEPAVQPLIFVAGNAEAPVIFQEKCIRLLADMNATESVDVLIQQLASPEPSIRALAARVIGKFGEARAIKPLMDILAKGDDEPDDVLAEVSLALGKLNASAASEALIAQLDHPSSKVRGYSISALGELKSVPAVSPLVERVLDAEQDNRAMMIQALANIGDPRAIEPFKVILNEVQEDRLRHVSNYLGSYVVQGLAKLGEGSVIHLLLSDWEEELETAVAILGERSLPYLEAVLNDDRNAHSRALAAEAMGIVGSPLALGALIKALQDGSDAVRTAAARSLNQVHSSQVRISAS